MGSFQSLQAGCSCRQFLVPTVAVVGRGLFLPGLRDQFLSLVAAVAAVGRCLSPPERQDRYRRLGRAVVVAAVAGRGSALLERKDRYRLERGRRMGCWLRRIGHWQLVAEAGAGAGADAGGLSGSVA